MRSTLQLDQGHCLRLRQIARERTRRMPRLIKISRTGSEKELEVSWTGNESAIVSKKYGGDIRYHVTLHKMATCSSKESELLQTST